MATASTSCTGGTGRQIAWVLATALSVAAGIALLTIYRPPLPARIAAVLVPIGCGLAYAFQLVHDMQKLDELQTRINLEATATACLGVFIAALVYPVVQSAGFAGPLQPYYVLILLSALWMAGYLNAYRRYR